MPLAIPAAAGRELYNLEVKRGSNYPFIIFCILLLNSPLFMAPQIWPALLAIDAVFAAFFLFFRWLLSRKEKLIALCDNGLVGRVRGETVFTPWSAVVSLSAFRVRVHSGYDVNAGDLHYRLQRTMLGDQLVADAVAIIAERAGFVWMGEQLAARNETLAKMADILART